MPADHAEMLMRLRAWTRPAVLALLAAAFWLTAGSAHAQTPSPTPSPEPSNNPFATLEPITLLMWLTSAAIALVAVLYAVNRERRKHGD